MEPSDEDVDAAEISEEVDKTDRQASLSCCNCKAKQGCPCDALFPTADNFAGLCSGPVGIELVVVVG